MATLRNPRHERYAQELAKGKTADEAYVKAGYKENRFNASRLRTNEHILRRVEELQDRGAMRAEVTLEGLILEAEEVRRLAVEAKQFSAAIRAIQEKGVLSGVRVDRSESQNTSTVYTVSNEPLTDDEWAAKHCTEN